jgi:hypothetical protein
VYGDCGCHELYKLRNELEMVKVFKEGRLRRLEYLRRMQEQDPCNGRAMAQAVNEWPPTSEARVRSRVSLYEICGGQSGTGTGFSPEYFGFPLSVSFYRCSITWKNEKK